jgi:hypothetical protein
MTDHELQHSGKRGGDRRSEKARAERAARQPSLVSEIAEQRQRLDQTFYKHIRKLRHEHGNRAVDQALSVWQQQRNAVAVAPDKQGPERRGPKFHYRERT